MSNLGDDPDGDVEGYDGAFEHEPVTVEIGGQTMTQAQFDAARYPLLHPDPGPVENPNREARHPYALDARQAFSLGTLAGLLTRELSVSPLKVSPVTDPQGNYLRLLRFTVDEGEGLGKAAWVMALVIE